MSKKKLIPVNKIEWSAGMLSFLKNNYSTMTNQELADRLGLKLTSTRTKLYELGFKRMELEYWTDDQVLFLKENYKRIGDVELAEIFTEMFYKAKGWTNKHIEKKRRYLKLKRTEQHKNEIQERNKEAGRFSINHWKRWFELKAKPGTIRIWKGENGKPFKVIKVADQFVHYAPFCFEAYFGPVPEGYIVQLLDSDNMNIKIENIGLMTRQESMLINSGSIKLSDNYVVGILTHRNPEMREKLKQHPELIELKRQQLKLNRQINEQGKN